MGKKIEYSRFQRSFSWLVYRCFLANEHLVEKGENKILYEKARRILIDIYCEEQNDYDEEGIERAIQMVALTQNKYHPNEIRIEHKVLNYLQ